MALQASVVYLNCRADQEMWSLPLPSITRLYWTACPQARKRLKFNLQSMVPAEHTITFIPWLSCKIINQNSAKSGTINVLYRSGITYITQQLDLFVKQYVITLETPFQVITCKSKLLFLKHAKCLAMWINHAFVNQHPPTDGFSSHSDFSCHSKHFAINGLLHTPL